VQVPIEPSISCDRVFRFGPFELSEREGELRKNGVRLKLQEQPFRVLVELVANAGKVVSREELQQKLWPADTFVDFDVGLNTTIRKLRQALNDDTDDPHYIETLAKRGYRFVGSVTDIATKSTEQQLQTLPDGIQVSDRLSVSSLESAGPVNALARSTRRWVWIPAGVVVVAIATAVVSLLNRPPAVPIVEAVTQLTDDGEPKPYTSRIVSDGVRVYFDEGTNGSLRIAQVAVAGGSVAVVPTTLAIPTIEGLSPEGSALLAKSTAHDAQGQLWLIPLPEGQPRPLGTMDVQDASFFPDGHIVFSRQGFLYAAEQDGSSPRKIVSVEGVIRELSVSPDGQRLVFTIWSREPLVPMSIVESMADGSGVQPLVHSSETRRVCCAQWSPDGRYIIFRSRNEGRLDLWLLPMKDGFFQRVQQPI
jgi:DNA-binding winged helix-turn-helix (wHTH) protein